MEVKTIEFTRGGKRLICEIGINAEGDSVLNFQWVDEVDTATESPLRDYPNTLPISFETATGRGNMKFLQTNWERGVIGANGNPVPNSGKPMSMVTNPQDQKSFIQTFAMPILMSMANGYVRAVLGYNDKPLFNPVTGEVLAYTPEQEQEPPIGIHMPGGYHYVPGAGFDPDSQVPEGMTYTEEEK